MSKRRALPVLLLRLACIALAGVALVLQAAAGTPSTSLSLLVGYATFLVLSSWMSWSSATGGRIPFLLMCGDLAALAAVGVLGGPPGPLSNVFASAYLVATLVSVVSRSGRGVRVQGMAGTIMVAGLAGMLVLLVGVAASAGLAAGEHLHLVAWMVLILAAVIEGTILTAWVMVDVQTRATQSDRMRTLGQTLSGVTHELANPLAALMGFADLVQGVGDETRREYLLTRIRDQAGRASKIVRRLRRFITVQNQDRTTSFEIHGSIDAVIELFAYEARKNRVEVKFIRSSRLHSVRAERHAIEQVFVNVHRNALRELSQHDGDRTIHVTVEAAAGGIKITWLDSGPGVDAANRRRVFDPFFSTHQDGGGMGLGLAISRGILRTNGGDLELAEATENGGAAFLLTLPLPKDTAVLLEESPKPVEKTVAPPPVPGAPTRHVLVIDDDDAFRDQLTRKLQRKNFDVSQVADIPGAESELGSGVFDIVLLSVTLPGRSGFGFFRSLRELTPQLSRKVILMTGDLSNQSIVLSAQESGTPLLLKPFRPGELGDAIQEVLERFPFSDGSRELRVMRAASQVDVGVG